VIALVPFAIPLVLAVCHVPGAFVVFGFCALAFVPCWLVAFGLMIASDATQLALWLWNYDLVFAFSWGWRFYRLAFRRLKDLGGSESYSDNNPPRS
jgi:hypothetical protein